MNIGDLVKLIEEPRDHEEHEIGIVVGFKPRGWQPVEYRDPDCDVWNNAIVLWPGFGISYHMRALLEVVDEEG